MKRRRALGGGGTKRDEQKHHAQLRRDIPGKFFIEPNKERVRCEERERRCMRYKFKVSTEVPGYCVTISTATPVVGTVTLSDYTQ